MGEGPAEHVPASGQRGAGEFTAPTVVVANRHDIALHFPQHGCVVVVRDLHPPRGDELIPGGRIFLTASHNFRASVLLYSGEEIENMPVAESDESESNAHET